MGTLRQSLKTPGLYRRMYLPQMGMEALDQALGN